MASGVISSGTIDALVQRVEGRETPHLGEALLPPHK